MSLVTQVIFWELAVLIGVFLLLVVLDFLGKGR
jgi:hypothetical protein